MSTWRRGGAARGKPRGKQMLCQLWEPTGPSQSCVRAESRQPMQEKGRKRGRNLCCIRLPLPCSVPGEKWMSCSDSHGRKGTMVIVHVAQLKITPKKQLDVNFAKGCSHRFCPWVALKLWVLSPVRSAPHKATGSRRAAALGKHRLHMEALGWKIVFYSTD